MLVVTFQQSFILLTKKSTLSSENAMRLKIIYSGLSHCLIVINRGRKKLFICRELKQKKKKTFEMLKDLKIDQRPLCETSLLHIAEVPYNFFFSLRYSGFPSVVWM